LKSPALMSPDEFTEMFEMVKSLMARLDGVLKPHGYNIGINVGRAGGAGYDKHVHLHIVPRWNGDTNFMPVVAGQKVISQSLFELKKALTGKPAGRRRRQQ
ncbi:MAG: HIT domain-containing protein, partial [Candidatus Omnitrophota bacterium]